MFLFLSCRSPAPSARSAHRRPMRWWDRNGVRSRPGRFGWLQSRADRSMRRGPGNATRKAPPRGGAGYLAPQTQTLDQRGVALGVPGFQVVEQTAALADHLQEAAPRMVILRVAFEMLGEVDDPLGQDGDLNFRRSGVALDLGVRLYDLGFTLGGNRHR